MTASPTTPGYRPRVGKIQRYAWKRGDQQTPGIALRQGRRIIAHLTPAEAIDLANRLVDLTETIEQETPAWLDQRSSG